MTKPKSGGDTYTAMKNRLQFVDARLSAQERTYGDLIQRITSLETAVSTLSSSNAVLRNQLTSAQVRLASLSQPQVVRLTDARAVPPAVSTKPTVPKVVQPSNVTKNGWEWYDEQIDGKVRHVAVCPYQPECIRTDSTVGRLAFYLPDLGDYPRIRLDTRAGRRYVPSVWTKAKEYASKDDFRLYHLAIEELASIGAVQ